MLHQMRPLQLSYLLALSIAAGLICPGVAAPPCKPAAITLSARSAAAVIASPTGVELSPLAPAPPAPPFGVPLPPSSSELVMPKPSPTPPTPDPEDASMGAGVLDRVGGALRLCAMCARTRCPAASAEHKLSSPASTAAATMRASRRALSPGFVGCEPRTPSMSNMALCGSRIVPPPSVPTSIDGIDTEICNAPRRLFLVEEAQSVSGRAN